MCPDGAKGQQHLPMASKTMKKEPLIPLFDEYKEWCKGNLTEGKSASDYPSRLKSINKKFISTIDTGCKKQPLELLHKYLNSSTKGPKWKLIDDLLTAISSRISQELDVRKTAGTVVSFGSERSAFNNYAIFIRGYVLRHPYRNDKICQTEDAALHHITGDHIVLNRKALLAIFASRLGTQDRITGHKSFLPLGLLTKICPKGTIRTWANKAADHVFIHTENGTVPVTDVDVLTIDTTTNRVTITLTNGSIESVYNPPLNWVKEPMEIKMISDTDIDHEPDIHSILQSMKGSLPALDYITKQILVAKQALGYSRIDSKNCNSVYAKLLADKTFMADVKNYAGAIPNELDNVTAQHTLQLAASGWNRSDKKQNQKNGTKKTS